VDILLSAKEIKRIKNLILRIILEIETIKKDIIYDLKVNIADIFINSQYVYYALHDKNIFEVIPKITETDEKYDIRGYNTAEDFLKKRTKVTFIKRIVDNDIIVTKQEQFYHDIFEDIINIQIWNIARSYIQDSGFFINTPPEQYFDYNDRIDEYLEKAFRPVYDSIMNEIKYIPVEELVKTHKQDADKRKNKILSSEKKERDEQIKENIISEQIDLMFTDIKESKKLTLFDVNSITEELKKHFTEDKISIYLRSPSYYKHFKAFIKEHRTEDYKIVMGPLSERLN
jgi:hypothetical protein